MKLILGYVHPKKEFNKETDTLMKIQVDNCLELGWKIEDIMFLANFDYEYRGVKSIPVEGYCDFCPVNSKTSFMVDAFKRGLIGDGIYWLHDLEAFQMEPITEEEIGLNPWDMALCDYGRISKWNGGSIFFRKSARDIFELTNKVMNQRKNVDEDALREVLQLSEKLYNRVKKLNVSYNYLPFNIRSCHRMAIKPIKVAHFDLFGGVRQLGVKSALKFYKGENKINQRILNDRLLNIFKKYEID